MGTIIITMILDTATTTEPITPHIGEATWPPHFDIFR